MELNEVFTTLATLAAAEDRTPDRIEVLRATDEQFMCRVWFPGEDDFDTFHILPS